MSTPCVVRWIAANFDPSETNGVLTGHVLGSAEVDVFLSKKPSAPHEDFDPGPIPVHEALLRAHSPVLAQMVEDTRPPTLSICVCVCSRIRIVFMGFLDVLS